MGKQQLIRWSMGAIAAALASVFAVTGCEPRPVEPRALGRLLDPGREAERYRPLVLANQLKVMLVSDPKADKSAAAMSVGVGSLDDPPDRPGLTHFLEHMLFLGTEKYPEPGSYQAYLSSHAGFSNAYTADDHTNFYFGVAHDGFEEALDRFAHFFVAPLLNEDYAGREVNAVASEHSKNLESDFWRVRQVVRGIYHADHPINRFSTGNLETLGGVGTEELRKFYREEYSANRMALALISNRGLDELEALVRKRFAAVENRDRPPHRYEEQYLARRAALRVVAVEPIADARSLTLEFPLPPTRQLYRAKPLQLIGFVLGHEGEGSLLSLLKARDYASALSAGQGDGTADYGSFELRIELTSQGLTEYQEVLRLVLGAIAGLRAKGVPQHVYEESRAMADINFRFRPDPSAASLARRLSAMMRVYPLEELPAAPYQFQEFRPDLVQGLLNAMTPDNMLVTLVAKGVTAGSDAETERYYGSRYAYREIEGRPYAALREAGPPEGWRLPEPNRYIPAGLALLEPEGTLKMAETTFRHLRTQELAPGTLARLAPLRGESFTDADELVTRLRGLLDEEQRGGLPTILKSAVAIPRAIIDTEQARVFFQPDWRVRQPKARMILKFNTDGAYGSPREAILARLYQQALDESLNEWGYPIRTAGLSYEISVEPAGVMLNLGGYSASMLTLLGDLVERLRDVDIDEPRFASLKERMARRLQNARVRQPYQQARYFGKQLLVTPNFPREALERELETATLAEVKALAARLYRQVYLEGVVVGNLDPAQAAAAIQHALGALGASILPEPLRIQETVREFPAGSDFVFSERLQVTNSFASHYYQVGETNPRLRGALLIISRPLGEKLYFNLRTQQQLGYIVYGGMGQIRKTLSLNLLVQSGAYPANELLGRIEAFVHQFVEEFAALSDQEFEQYREAVIQAKLERPKDNSEAARRLFWIAFENDEKFDHVSEDILAVEALSREEVEAVLRDALVGDQRRRLAMRLAGKEHPMGEPRGQPIALPWKKAS